MGGGEEVRSEDLFLHPNKIIEKKHKATNILYFMLFFGNFNSTQNRSSVLISSFIN
jgi:hypothetical protein